MPDYKEYRKSISRELISIKDRVRLFVKHWPEDGRYKEIILADVLKKHLPSNVNVGTGFVLNGDKQTTQIDILIYNNDPVFFKYGDFVIVSSESVLGIIEVKSKLRNINEAVKKAHENGEIIDKYIFNGIFSYENAFGNIKSKYLESIKLGLKKHPGYVNNVAIGEDYFIRYWDQQPAISGNKRLYRSYHLEELAFGYFIGNLVEDVQIQITGKAVSAEMANMLYPDKKENFKLEQHDIIIGE